MADERGTPKTHVRAGTPPPRAAAPSARTSPAKKSPAIADPYIGRVVDGRFELLSVIGRGGMGQVYKARQSPLGRLVAMKIMAGTHKPDRAEEFQRRFFLEASTSAKLSHPNTITIFDYGSDEFDGDVAYFIAMELIDGVTLSRALRAGPFEPARAVNIGLQMCRSLREAHRAKVVHRDLKPGNVMLTRPDGEEAGHESDFVKVLDFGLAKSFTDDAEGLTRAGTFLGSPRYVAPEQIEGKLVDPRADIYAFGVVLYRMLCGSVPFDGTQPVEIMMKHLHDDVPVLPTSTDAGPIPRALSDLVYDCLRKKPAQRPQSMGEVITRLKLAHAALGGVSIPYAGLSDELSEGMPRAPSDAADEDELPAMSAPPADISDPSGKAIESDAIMSQRPTTDERPATSGRPAPPDAETVVLPSADAGAGGFSPLAIDDEILDNTRPTHVLGRPALDGPREPRRRVFVAGLVLGAALAGVALVAFSLQALAPRKQPIETPAKRLAIPVELRIATTPPSEVFLVNGTDKKRLGISPLTLNWMLSPDDAARTLRFEREGFRPAVARVAPPAEGAPSPTVLEVGAKLRPLE